jgi:uncharacterized protein (TIGR00266 family)
MNVEIRHSPSFAAARVSLASGESVKVEAGAMMMHSAGVTLHAAAEGGMMKSLARGVLGGESLFISTFTAPHNGGWVDVAPRMPGDVVVVNLSPGEPLNITKGSWLCSSPSVELDTKFGGFKSMIGGEGAFLVRATGHGELVLSCYGALDVTTLAPGEQITVDTGHVVAFEHTVQQTIRKAGTGGIVQSMKSGEGLVFDFIGPGDVLTQTRNPGPVAGVGSRS